VEAVGFVFGGFSRPTPFICLLLKLIQIKPDKETIVAYLSLSDGPLTDDVSLQRSDMRYLRALAAVYVRLALPRSPQLYELLEPLLADCRKLSAVHADGRAFRLPIDSLVELLLSQIGEPVLGLALPPLVKREVLEKRRQLGAYSTWLPTEEVDAALVEMQPRAETANLAGVEEELGIDATNRIRAKLGLKPLE
jgi:pre-mRNA-splicing factor 38A